MTNHQHVYHAHRKGVATLTVVFVCQHGSAKSLIAAQHFNRIAAQSGISMTAVCAGLEPYAEVPAPVVTGLAENGIDVSGFIPQQLTSETFAGAAHVVHFGCTIEPHVVNAVTVEDWGDVPAVSDGFELAHNIIVHRVERLIDTILQKNETE